VLIRKGHGRDDVRALLLEIGLALLRSPNHPNAKWGHALMARKGEGNLVATALARKLAVQAWYVLSGKTEPPKAIDARMGQKIGKMITRVGEEGVKSLGLQRKDLREQVRQRLLAKPTTRVREYPLDMDRGTPGPAGEGSGDPQPHSPSPRAREDCGQPPSAGGWAPDLMEGRERRLAGQGRSLLSKAGGWRCTNTPRGRRGLDGAAAESFGFPRRMLTNHIPVIRRFPAQTLIHRPSPAHGGGGRRTTPPTITTKATPRVSPLRGPRPSPGASPGAARPSTPPPPAPPTRSPHPS